MGPQIDDVRLDINQGWIFTKLQIEKMSNQRWTPFGDVSLDMGCLAVVEASHQAPEFKHLQVIYVQSM